MSHLAKEMNCILERFVDGKIEGKIRLTGRRGKRRKKLLDYLNDREDTGNSKGSTRLHFVEPSLWESYDPIARWTTE